MKLFLCFLSAQRNTAFILQAEEHQAEIKPTSPMAQTTREWRWPEGTGACDVTARSGGTARLLDNIAKRCQHYPATGTAVLLRLPSSDQTQDKWHLAEPYNVALAVGL